jgi:hypothetical protein
LIGGQALNYWAEHYLDASPLLRAEAPFASGDIDFLRGLPTAERLARLLPGRLHLGTVYDSGVTIAAIEYRDSDGDPRVIHFLGRMHGVDPNEVVKTSFKLEGYLRIMHPVLCLESRLSNLFDLAEYRTDHGRKQAHAAIECAKTYVSDQMNRGEVAEVLKANERIFTFAKRRAAPCAREGFRPFEAALLDDRLPEKFRTIRYPQMLKAMDRRHDLVER